MTKFEYIYKAHETEYAGVLFRSRLEATWAAFFDLIGWEWEYEPLDLPGWTPDFRVVFPCNYSECNDCHVLLVEVKPYYDIKEFEDHPCMKYPYGVNDNGLTISDYDDWLKIPACASAAFGNNWKVVEWEMSHGSGGGLFNNIAEWANVSDHMSNFDHLWREAGNITRYKVGIVPGWL